MSERPTAASMTRGTLYAALSHVLSILIPIVSVPWSISRLGEAVYGRWIELSILAMWCSHLDLGLWAGIGRATAERRARGDEAGLRTLFASWLRWDLAASAVLVGAVAVLARYVPAPTTAVVALAVQAATIPVMRHFMYAIAGFQRVDLVHRTALVVGPLSLAAVIAVLEAGAGLSGLALVGAGSGLLQIGIFAALLRGLGYPLAAGPFRGGELRALMGFGWKLELSEVLTLLARSDRLLLGRVGVSKEAVTSYQLGASIPERLAGSVTLLSAGMMPAGADLAARGDRDRLRTLFLRGTKYHAFAATLLLGFAAVFAEELFLLWMGKPLPGSARVLRLLAAGGWCFAVGSCAQSLLVGAGRSGRQLAAVVGGLAVAVLLYSAWGRRYHVTGLAASVAAGTAFGQVLLMIFLRGSVEFRWRELVGSAILKPLSAGVPLLGLWASHRFLPVPAGRLEAFLLLASAFLAAAALGAFLARATRALDDYDWGVLKTALRRRPA